MHTHTFRHGFTMLALPGVLALLLAACSGGEKAPGPHADKALHVQGTALVNAQGDTMDLKGVSFGWHNLWPKYYNARAVKSIHRQWGCELFRFSIGIDDLGEGGKKQPGYLSDPALAWKCLTAGVDAAISCGAYAIIDWHSHKLHMDEAKAFFGAVSKLYADEPLVIYELYNEPVDDSWPALKSYAEALVKVIRANAPDALILMGCPHWDQDIDLPAQDPLRDAGNLMYTMHFYAGTHKAELRDRTTRAIAKGLPVFISECAAMEASGDGPLDYASWEEWLRWAEGLRLPMVMWSVSDKQETCSMLVPGAPAGGGWSDAQLKEWGVYVRQLVKDSSL